MDALKSELLSRAREVGQSHAGWGDGRRRVLAVIGRVGPGRRVSVPRYLELERDEQATQTWVFLCDVLNSHVRSVTLTEVQPPDYTRTGPYDGSLALRLWTARRERATEEPAASEAAETWLLQGVDPDAPAWWGEGPTNMLALLTARSLATPAVQVMLAACGFDEWKLVARNDARFREQVAACGRVAEDKVSPPVMFVANVVAARLRKQHSQSHSLE